MKLTKEILVKLIKEEVSKIDEAEKEELGDEEGEPSADIEADIGRGKGVSGSQLKQWQAQQAKKSTQEFGPFTPREKSIYKQASEILKQFALLPDEAGGDLAAGKALSSLKVALKPFQKAIKKHKEKSGDKTSSEET